MGEEEPDGAEKSGRHGIVDSVAAENAAEANKEVVTETNFAGISGLKDVQSVRDDDGKQGSEFHDANDQTPQASSAQDAVSRVQGIAKNGKEVCTENQEAEQKGEMQDGKGNQKASDDSPKRVKGSATPKQNGLEAGGNPADRSIDAASQVLHEERNVVKSAVLGFSTTQVTPSSIPPLSSCSTSPERTGAQNPELVSRLASEEVDLAPKSANEADSSAYDDLPPLDKLQKDTLSLGRDCLDHGVPNTHPSDLVENTAPEIPVCAASEDLVLGTDHELLQPALTPVGFKAAKSGRLQFYSPRRSLGASQKDKAHVADLSLRHVLSDPIS